ncbi:hypothetical protein Vretimale_8417, partial [Volvox reticuliferus]
MATEAAAVAAAGSVCGDPSEPLLVVPLVGNMAAEGDQQRDGGDKGDQVAAVVSEDGGGAGLKQQQRLPDDGLLPGDGAAGRSEAAGPGPRSLLQRPARLPDPPAGTSARPLFPAAGRGAVGSGSTAAFPAFGGGGLFPSTTGAASAAAAGRPAMSFPSGPGEGGPGFGSWRTSAPGGIGG